MKKLLFSMAFLVWALPGAFSQDAEKLLMQNVSLQGEQSVVLDLDYPYEIKRWKRSQMQVRMGVELPGQEYFVLKSLIYANRYHVVSEKTPEGLRLFTPELFRTVLFKGLPLEEKITVQVYLPQNVRVKMPVGATVAKTNVDGMD